MITRRDLLAAGAGLPFLGWSGAAGCMQGGGALTTRMFGARHDDSTDDVAALEAAIAQAIESGRPLTWSSGIARVSRPVRIPSGARIVAESADSGIRNVSRAINNLRSPLLIGNWHPGYLGYRPLGADGPWLNDKVDLVPTRSGCSAGSTSVRLGRAADAARFAPGQVYPLLTQEMDIQTTNGIQLRISRDQSLLRVARVDAGSGIVTFDTPIGFDSAGPLYLVRIRDSATDDHGLPIYIARDVEIDGLQVHGFTAFGNNCAAMYRSRLSNFTGDVSTPVMANSLAHSVIDGFRGRFSGSRLVEVKYGHHDGAIRNFVVENGGEGTAQAGDGLFSVGEYCRDLVVEDFRVNAPRWRGGHLFQLQPGKNCVFRRGRVFAPLATFNAVWFYSDGLRSITGSGLESVEVTHGSEAHVVFSAGAHEPNGCFVRDCSFVTRATGPATAVAFLGGQDNEVTGNEFNRGGLSFSGDSARGNLVEGNRLAAADIEGAAVGRNRIGTNYVRGADESLVPFSR